MKWRKSTEILSQMREELLAYNDKVVGTTHLKATELVALYIRQKLKMYDHIFVLIRNSFRIIMLNYKLKLPVHRDVFNPIVITYVGVMMSITGIFKIWMKERHKNFHGRYVKMQDFIKMMPRVEQLNTEAGRDDTQNTNNNQNNCAKRVKAAANLNSSPAMSSSGDDGQVRAHQFLKKRKLSMMVKQLYNQGVGYDDSS